MMSSRGSSVSIVTRLRAGRAGFDSWQGQLRDVFNFAIASRPDLGPTQRPNEWIQAALSLGIKRPGRQADHSPPSSAEIKNAWSYTSVPPYVLMALCTGTSLLLPV
jgi:hypothetical protein